ncbi:MAG: serine--tRNA ligase [Candidatus Babeliales bacterium]
MIDLGLLREKPDFVISLLKKKEPSFDIQLLIDLDKKRRELQIAAELLRHQKNELSQQAKNGITPALRSQSIDIGKQLKEKEADLKKVEEIFHEHYLRCPNIIARDVPAGGEEANQVIREYGKKISFLFPIKNHVELGEALGWFDFETATKIAGNNFALYKGDAVRLLYALILFMLKNNTQHGYQVVSPSVLVNEASLEVASNFPKFKDQVYKITEDNLYLTPTAEVNLANLYRNHIFMENELPVRLTAWTSCFRREAGSYGATERGLIRIHQFEKVELFTICEPKDSANELEQMITTAESILKKLDLHYRIVLLAAQECSFPSAKTYDIEVWLPGQKDYYEVSSVSNCTNFQARRGKIRYKESSKGKTHLVHTLNGSSLALPRLMVALMEVYQQKDGSIVIPSVLKETMFF